MRIMLIICFYYCAVISNALEEKEIKIGGAINFGYLFYNGKYVELPYNFTRTVFSVYVNGDKVFYPEMLIKHLMRNRDKNVDINAIPKKITYDEFQNPVKPWGAYEKREIHRIIKKHPKDYTEFIVAFYQKLPFIKKVSVDDQIKGLINIETLQGDATGVFIGDMLENDNQTETIPTRLDVEEMVENAYAMSIQKELKKGNCVFIFSNVGVRLILNNKEIQNNLPEIVNVLESQKSKNQKINKLYRLRLFSRRKFPEAEILVENFERNKELKKRIKKINNWRRKVSFKRQKIEEQPTGEELSNAEKVQSVPVQITP